MPEQEGVIEESPTLEDVNAEESSVSETVVEEKVLPEAIPYDRFQEKVKQAEQLKKEAEYFRDQAFKLAEQRAQPIVPQEADPFVNADYQTKEFIQQLDKRYEGRTKQIAESYANQFIRENEALKRTIAVIQEKEFRREQKDVEPNSPEEAEIAHLISMGISPDKAAWAVMGEKRVERAKQGTTTKINRSPEKKMQANLETKSVSKVTSLPQESHLTFRQKVEQEAKKLGI